MRLKGQLLNVMTLVSGTGTAQLLVILASPLLTRLFTPTEFGVLAIFISIISILVVISALQYEKAIPLPELDEISGNLLVLSTLSLALVCCFTGLGLWFGKEYIFRLLKVEILKGYFWLIPVSLFGAGVFQVLNNWTIRKGTFDRIAKAKVRQSLSMVSTQLVSGIMGVGALGLLLGDAIGRMGGSTKLIYQLFKEDRRVFNGITFTSLRDTAIRYKDFPLYSGSSVLLKEITNQMPALILAIYYGPKVLGLFMITQRVLAAPLALVGNAVASVYTSEAAKLVRESPEELQGLFWLTIRYLALISIPLIGLVAVLAPRLFPIIFGNAWRDAGIYLSILACMYLFQFISIPVAPTLYVVERQGLQLWREIIRLTLMGLTFLIIAVKQPESQIAIFLISIAGSVGFIINAFYSWYGIKLSLRRKGVH